MKNLLRLISLFIALYNCKPLILAQCFNEPEEIEAPESTFFDTECTPEFFSKNGRYLPTKGIIRILVVFAEIDYSFISGSDPTGPDGTPEWPAHQLPDWADDIGNPTVPTTIGEAYGLTKYFLYASSGEYTVLVDYLVAPINGGIFSTTGREPEHIVSSVNSALGSSIVTNSGLNSINYFDLWTTNTSTTGEGKPKITPSNENPRRFDHIMFIWRNKRANNGAEANNTGSAHSSSPGNMLGFDANTYTQNISYDNLPLRLLRHEYGHLLYGGNNFHCSGGGTNAPGYFQHLVGGWSNMSLHDGALLSWNAWDRQRMDWKVTGSTNEITARNHNNSSFVNGDLDATNPAHAGTYSLRDFVIHGDALRIKLPYIDPDNEFEQFLWIENHRGIGENNVEFDKWMHEHNACVENLVPGMYAYKQIDRENRAGCTSNAVYSGHADYLRPLNANGHWDRALELTDNFNDCVQWGNTKPFIRTAPNPLTGLADMDRNMQDSDNIYNIEVLVLSETSIFNYTEKIGSTYHKHLFNNGHTDHAFTRFGKNKIGISTNPSSANVINLVRSGDLPLLGQKNVRRIYLNGVSIEIIDYHSGVMKVEIRFDDVDVEEDVRWCGEEIVLNPISSPSGYSLNIKEDVTLMLDQGLTATRMNNPQTFNGEKIFVSNTLFRALDQSHIHLEENSNLIVDNNSEFRLESGSRMDLEDGARLIVKRGGLVYVEPGAAILLAAQGKIIIEHGGKMIVDGVL